MTTVTNEEKLLLETYVTMRAEVEMLEEKLKFAKLELEGSIVKLHESLQAHGATKTAVYSNIGSYAMKEPSIIASVKNENQEELFEYLYKEGRGDLIKPTCHWKTLSSYAKEVLSDNRALPSFISIYYKPSGIFYPAK